MLIKSFACWAVAWLPVVWLVSQAPAVPQMSPLQLVTWGIVVSIVGGLAAASRTEHHWWDFLKVALNTGVIGGAICAFSIKWTMADPRLGWMLLAVVTVLSAAGLVFVELVVNVAPQYARRWFERVSGYDAGDEHADETDDNESVPNDN